MSEEKKVSCCGGDCSTEKTIEQVQTTVPLGGVTRPKIDILETESAYLLNADMPGADETTTEVIVEKNILTIKGVAAPFNPEGFESVYRESGQRNYQRMIRLPEQVEPSRLEATVKNGVLKIKLPKSEAAKTIRVQVNAG